VKRAALALALAACTSDRGAEITYPWDGRGVLCSASIDDYQGEPPWDFVEASLDYARRTGSVTMIHTHVPGASVTLATVAHLLELAEARELDFVTFRDFTSATPRGGLALAFDDNAPDAWLTARDLLATHGARVTFFVSRWSLLTDAERDEIRLLASDGHDLEPHSVHHLHGVDYVDQYGLDAYMTDEVLPSFEVMAAEGYPPTTYAYPFGDHDDAMDAAILAKVAHVRTTLGPCPY